MNKYDTGNLFGPDEAEVASGGHVVRVAFEAGVDNEFDYILPDSLWPIQPGQRVEAPFGRNNKLQTGFCVDVATEDAEEHRVKKERKFKLKSIKRVIDKISNPWFTSHACMSHLIPENNHFYKRGGPTNFVSKSRHRN